MSEYEGFFAEFYDVIHAHAHEAPGYVALARETGGPLLELGCGTGRLLIPLAEAGFEITGVDGAPDMLARCRAKLEAAGADVAARATLVEGDLSSFLTNGPFRMIFLACNTICHLHETEEVLACFARAKKHLAADGILVIDNSVPDFPGMVESNGIAEVSEYLNPETGRQIVCSFRADFNFTNQRETNRIEIAEMEGGEPVRTAETDTTMTWYLPREIRALLTASGFAIRDEWGHLTSRTPLGPKSREMIFTATPAR